MGEGAKSQVAPLNIFTGFLFRVKMDFISADAIEFKVPQKAAVDIASGVTASCDMMSLCGAVASCAMKLL